MKDTEKKGRLKRSLETKVLLTTLGSQEHKQWSLVRYARESRATLSTQ